MVISNIRLTLSWMLLFLCFFLLLAPLLLPHFLLAPSLFALFDPQEVNSIQFRAIIDPLLDSSQVVTGESSQCVAAHVVISIASPAFIPGTVSRFLRCYFILFFPLLLLDSLSPAKIRIEREEWERDVKGEEETPEEEVTEATKVAGRHQNQHHQDLGYIFVISVSFRILWTLLQDSCLFLIFQGLHTVIGCRDDDSGDDADDEEVGTGMGKRKTKTSRRTGSPWWSCDKE